MALIRLPMRTRMKPLAASLSASRTSKTAPDAMRDPIATSSAS